MNTSAHDYFEGVILRQVLECASPLARCVARRVVLKRQRAAAVQDAIAHLPPSAIGGQTFYE